MVRISTLMLEDERKRPLENWRQPWLSPFVRGSEDGDYRLKLRPIHQKRNYG